MSKALSIVIRPDYLTLCEGNHCAAAILDLFRRWTFYKKNKGGEAGAWIYKSQPNMAADMFGLFGENKVAAALNYLCDKGFLKWRHNPHSRQNKTRQYRFEDAAVKAALKLQNETLKAQNQGLETSEQRVEALELSSQGHKNAASDSKNQSDSSSKSLSDQSSSHPPPDDDWKPFLQFEEIFHCSPETDIRTALIREYKRLGEAQAVVVLERCRPSARTWKYLLTSLTNEHSNEGSDGAKWRDDQYGVNVPTPAPDTPTLSAEESEPTKRESNRWPLAIATLEVRLDRREFDAWMRGAELLSLEDGTCRVGVRTAHAAAMLKQRLAVQVRGILSDILGEIKTVEFETLEVQA